MPEQQTLFQERRRTDASSETGYVLEQEAPEEDADTEAVAAAALSALEEDVRRDSLRSQYARLLWQAATKGVTLQADTGRLITLEALTDKEAAKMLGCEKTTINARRNELMGDEPQYEACPVVVEHETRESHVRGTGLENTTYTINERLIAAGE